MAVVFGAALVNGRIHIILRESPCLFALVLRGYNVEYDVAVLVSRRRLVSHLYINRRYISRFGGMDRQPGGRLLTDETETPKNVDWRSLRSTA